MPRHAIARVSLAQVPHLLPVGVFLVVCLIAAGTASAASTNGLQGVVWGDSLTDAPAPSAMAWPDAMGHKAIVLTKAAPANVNWAVLRCAFPGSPAYPLTSTQTLRLFEKPDVGLLAFFDRQARGHTQMSVAWVEQVTLR